MESLFEKLRENRDSDRYPYHMPGHKRRACRDLSEDLCGLDITEIDGFDNLHQPTEILLRLQKQAARLYGAEESFFLVNGSTAGVLASVSAGLPRGGHILMARNCHKSAYHAAYLRGLEITYLYPPLLTDFDIFDAVTEEQVQKALTADPQIGAVLLTSPTYEGRISDIRAIAELVHDRGIPLIVDEAHGAHLGFGKVCAENSCMAGADLVIHSVHKTLPALTQTALLHVNGKRIDRERLRRFLHIYQTSSPSYLLMASIGNVLQFLEEDGERAFEAFEKAYSEMQRQLGNCNHLRIFPWEARRARPMERRWNLSGEKHQFLPQEQSLDFPQEPYRANEKTMQDIGKLVISTKGTSLSGRKLYDILLNRYGLQLEMAGESYVLAMFTVNDSPEAYQRMTQALLEIDRELEHKQEMEFKQEPELNQDRTLRKYRTLKEEYSTPQKAICRIPLAQAWDMEKELVKLSESAGCCAGEFVNLYPPGVPILVPGEEITEELCDRIKSWMDSGLEVQGVVASEYNTSIAIIKMTRMS